MDKFGHGGNVFSFASGVGCSVVEVLDFSANINPVGPPLYVKQILENAYEEVVHYPPIDNEGLISRACEVYKVERDEILFGNGSSELLYLLPRAIDIPKALIPVPSYVDYERACEIGKKDITFVYLKEEENFSLDVKVLEKYLSSPSLVFLGRPSNPVGGVFPLEDLYLLAHSHPHSLFLIDEAFADFCPQKGRAYEDRPPNVAVLLSYTKFFSIPGLRLGALIGERGLIARIREMLPPWSVNLVSLRCGERFLVDGEFKQKAAEEVRRLKQEFFNGLIEIEGIRVFPSDANFFLIKLLSRGINAPLLQQRLFEYKILIRDCSNYRGLTRDFIRVAVRGREENRFFTGVLKEVVEAKNKVFSTLRPTTSISTPAIMFVGTCSNAGKSILAAGMCRILLQEGLGVAPFKAQNMSLNSYVTIDGGEMGRAQVLQAQACKLEPDVRMNPVLLKPSSDTGSQVIVMGRPVGNMDVEEYIKFKKELLPIVRDAYDSLAREFDVIVMEGAGSPAEINLKSHDITNMEMARYARAKTFLIGDIDRGGVFASFVGTLSLMNIWERELIEGLIINKFRGDEELLGPALEYTTSVTGKPFLGIVPYIRELGLPEEDSVSFKGRWDKLSQKQDAPVRIACIDLPHISNFTDLDPLLLEPDVYVEIVRDASGLREKSFDAIIIPGSKSVITDCQFLFSSGIAGVLKEIASKGGCEIIGICGGFQMLGEVIHDPYCLESSLDTMKGLSLLPLVSELEREKTLTQTDALHIPSGIRLKGYEIHHGKTYPVEESVVAVVKNARGEEIGFGRKDMYIWGSYLHGIFDTDTFRRWFLDRLRQNKGYPPLSRIQVIFDIEKKLDELAQVLRDSLDLEKILSLIS